MQKRLGSRTSRAATAGHTWMVLMRATQAIGRQVEADFSASSLSSTDFRILEALMSKGPLAVNAIGPMAWLTPGSISVAIDRLLARELVTRQECARDRRIRTVALTPTGDALIRDAFARHLELLERIFEPLGPAERETLEGMLKTIGKRGATLNDLLSDD